MYKMLTYENPNLVLIAPIETGTVTCKSPSNIAIVKYWGKFGRQIRANKSSGEFVRRIRAPNSSGEVARRIQIGKRKEKLT